MKGTFNHLAIRHGLNAHKLYSQTKSTVASLCLHGTYRGWGGGHTANHSGADMAFGAWVIHKAGGGLGPSEATGIAYPRRLHLARPPCQLEKGTPK